MENLHELCRLRATLESFAALRLRDHPQRETIFKSLHGHLKNLQKVAQRSNYIEFNRVDMRLHRELVAACGPPELVQSWDLVAAGLEPWLTDNRRAHWPSLMALYREHIYLLEAWGSHDPWVVEEATRQHLEAGWYRAAIKDGKIPSEGDSLDRVASFLSTHHASRVSMEWVAKNVGYVSTSHMNRLFRKQFGKSPYAWLRQVRMDRAAQLLSSTEHNVAQVGRMVGYKNASHFVRDFRDAFQKTPKQFHLARG